MLNLTAGHFTRTDVWQILGLPIIPASSDLTSPAPVILYTPVYGPNFSEGPVSWNEEVIFPSHFRLIHDVKLVEGGNNGLDLILVAGREGIVSLWFEASVNLWNFAVLGQGLPQSGNNPYWGSGSVDIAAVEDDPIGYIATCEVSFETSTLDILTDPRRHSMAMSCLSISRLLALQLAPPLSRTPHTGGEKLLMTTVL